MKSTEEKYSTIIKKNTFYYFDEDFETEYENHIFSVKECILHLKNLVQNEGCKKETLEKFLNEKKEFGLKAILAITGFSNESLLRLITVIRIVDSKELNEFTYKDKWDISQEVQESILESEEVQEKSTEVSEWRTAQIEGLIRKNEFFRKALVNIFFDGATNEFLRMTLPTFEFKKFSLEKLNFEPNALIDTLARYKEKGSRAAKGRNNAEDLISKILDKLKIPFQKGDLHELIEYASDEKRTMDFIIPNKSDPRVIIESSFLVTTSSGQGDKSKTEINVDKLIKEKYPNALFIGFIDGIGWYVRKKDLARMVNAYEDVFTFHSDELSRFENLLIETFIAR